MSKMLLAVSLLTAVSACNKKNDFSRFEDYGIASVSWGMVSEMGGVSTENAYRLHIDQENTLWVGTFGNGLIRIGDEVQHYTTANSALPNDSIVSMASDRNGALWGGTAQGLFKLAGNAFQVYNTSNAPMVINQVFTLALDREDKVWFSSGNADEGGLMKFNQIDEWTLFTPENSALPIGIINAIHFDEAGTLWTGHGMWRGAGGIWTRTSSGLEQAYTISNSNLAYNWISQIAGDKTGAVWVGTNAIIFLDSDTLHGGLQVFQGGDFVSHNPASSGQATNRVECLAFDEPGNLWVSTGLDAPTFDLKHEVSLYNQKNWLVLSKEIKGFPNLRVTAIAIRGNTVWMATALGLLKVQLEYQ